ncbi:MAG: MFS transporter [Kofleriaceae bacterium]|nr:MFS transporter [Kofleriaceae bacterium]
MKSRSPLLPIFLIVLVDILGYTIVFPLLGFYAERFGATPFVATLLVSVYAGCSLISSPILGRLSDRFGRRRLLLLSQAGTCLGFLVLGVADTLWLVFVGRILDGVTAGNLTIAQAYISDNTEAKNRSKAFAVIGIAFGIGFSFGPLISGQLSKHGLHAPFLAAAGLSLLSMFCTYFLLPKEGRIPEAGAAANNVSGDVTPPPSGRRPNAFDWRTYAEYLRRPGVGNLMLQFFLFSFAFSCFTSNFALFSERRFHWGPEQVGYLFAVSGLLGIILQGGLIGRLVKKYGEPTLAIAGFASAAIAYFVLGVAGTLSVIGIAVVFSAFGNGVLRPVVTSRITQSVGRHEQGAALGVSQSLSSIAMIIAPPAGGILINNMMLTEWGILAGSVAVLGLMAAIAGRSIQSTEANAPAVVPPAQASTSAS